VYIERAFSKSPFMARSCASLHDQALHLAVAQLAGDELLALLQCCWTGVGP
jgi:hypothetical protein